MLDAETIHIDSLPIPYICSNKCRTLGFCKTVLTKDYWTHLIEKCDLSGVMALHFGDFDICTSNRPNIQINNNETSHGSLSEKQEIANKICAKMVN